MCTENTFADLFCVEALKRYIFSEFSVYIRKVLSIEHVDFIRVFLLYLPKRNDGQNLVPKMGINLHIIGICASTHMPSPGLSADIRRIHLSEREKL